MSQIVSEEERAISRASYRNWKEYSEAALRMADEFLKSCVSLFEKMAK